MPSLTALTVTVPVLVVASAAMISLLFVVTVKSPASVLVPAAAEISMVVVSLDA